MSECYIFNYVTAELYHVTIPKEVEDVEKYLKEKYNLDSNMIEYMMSDVKLEIKEL